MPAPMPEIRFWQETDIAVALSGHWRERAKVAP
jgi:hypothetical protein